MNKHKKESKKLNFRVLYKENHIGIRIINVLVLVLDVIICLIALACFILTIFFIIYLINNNVWLVHWISNLSPNECSANANDIVSNLLGVSISGVIVPVISFVITLIVADTAEQKDIANLLAKAKKIRLFFMPREVATWHNFLSTVEKKQHEGSKSIQETSKLNLAEADKAPAQYCLHLVFEGENFQAYQTELREVGYENFTPNSTAEGKVIFRSDFSRNWFVSDATGVANNKTISGTNISVLLNEGKPVGIKNSEDLLDVHNQNKNFYFILKFKRRSPDAKNIWYRWKYSFQPFPIIRSIYNGLLEATKKSTYYKISLNTNNFTDIEPFENWGKKFEYNIYDIDIDLVREPPLKPKWFLIKDDTEILGAYKKSKKAVKKLKKVNNVNGSVKLKYLDAEYTLKPAEDIAADK